jgi:hypothetical protein
MQIITGIGIPDKRPVPILRNTLLVTNTDFPLQMMYARPRKMDIAARVAIKGSSFSLLTSVAFMNPIAKPRRRTSSMARKSGSPLFRRMETNTPENAATDPGDKSTCPTIRRKHSPITTSPTMEEDINMLVIFAAVRYLLPVNIENTINMIIKAIKSPSLSDLKIFLKVLGNLFVCAVGVIITFVLELFMNFYPF